jgi:hypothetical protein
MVTMGDEIWGCRSLSLHPFFVTHFATFLQLTYNIITMNQFEKPIEKPIKIISQEDGEKRFKEMRDKLSGVLSADGVEFIPNMILQDADGEVTKVVAKQPAQKPVFKNSSSAMADWQKQQEDDEERRAELRNQGNMN